MKILKRSKGEIGFRTDIGTILLYEGENNLTNEQFKRIKNHPLFEASLKTSGINIKGESKYKLKKDSTSLLNEVKEEVKEEKDSIKKEVKRSKSPNYN